MLFVLVILAAIISTVCLVPAALLATEPAEFFRSRVEPILSRHCYECHSHTANKMQSGLALDWKSGWSTGGDRGPAIIPGKPEDSLLIRAISHSDPDLQMPATKLAAVDIQTLTAWVRDGAYDDRMLMPKPQDEAVWWSLKPLARYGELPFPMPDKALQNEPHVADARTDSSTFNNPIDAFVAQRLAAEGLTLSPIASPRDLIRRVYFDLVGLPPSPAKVTRFAEDPSERNYLRIVDGLLASPRYGEHWARHWFDTIHFADSHGYEHDVGRDNAWPYRDYVIDAFNSDRPWSTFIRQQLAVDYFQPEATDLLPALGFLGAGTFDYSTYQTGPVTFDYLDRDDMLTQTMSAFQSATANCARCHAHKFDPIPQEDYYALQAIFAGIVKGDIPYDEDRQVAAERHRWTTLLEAVQRSDGDVLQSDPVRQLVANWEHERSSGAQWTAITAQSFLSTEGAILDQNAEAVIVASGTAPETDTYIITGQPSLSRITAVRLELLPHDSLPMHGPGRCQNGNLHLSHFTVTLFQPGESSGKAVAIQGATADFNQEGWEVHRAIDKDMKTAWGIYPAVGQSHYAVFEFAQPIDLPAGSTLTFTLKQLHGGSHLIGAFRLSVTDEPGQRSRALPANVHLALATPANLRTAEQRDLITKQAVRDVTEQQIALLPPQRNVYAIGTKVAIPLGSGKSQPASIAATKKVHLLKRGDISQPQQEVAPGALSALAHMPSRFLETTTKNESARRAALADWIAHPENVLTWRSLVNRVWHYHFGRGLCDTPSDLGRMGGLPSHPELIDWLAVWFRDEAHGSLKQLHRLIVTSHTYRQSSADNPRASAVDAGNRWLWRQNRSRLDADTFRDYVLAAAGRVDWTMGGPAIQHFHQSPGAQLTPQLDYAAYDWASRDANRRSIYRYVWRGIPDPLMSSLDFPDLGLLTPVRSQSISPLQALALLNNNFVLFQSQSMAQQIEAQSRDIDSQIAEVVQRCYHRTLSDDELLLFRAYVGQHGLAALCRLLFNSNEFLFVP